jgi:copper chaperone NosL
MQYRIIIVLIACVLSNSCEVRPDAINYNEDQCEYCKMKISDTRFGAELVTRKGKIYKYDSAECLLRTLLENDIDKYAYKLVTDIANPKNL